MDGIRIVFREEFECPCNQFIMNAEHAIYKFLFGIAVAEEVRVVHIVRKSFEFMRRDFAECLQKSLVDQEGRLAVAARIVEFLTSQSIVFQQCISQHECRIDQYAPESAELFRIHGAHGGSDNQIRFLLRAKFPEHLHCFVRVDRKVRGDYLRIRQQCPHCFHGAVLPARSKSMQIQYLFPGHQIRSCILEKFHLTSNYTVL